MSDNQTYEITNGKDGAPGTAWTIGEDGMWYKDGVKTDYKAIGVDGAVYPQYPKGDKGDQGEQGIAISLQSPELSYKLCLLSEFLLTRLFLRVSSG